MNTRLCRLLVLSALFFVALAAETSAAALDGTFGQDGRVAVELGMRGSRANAVVAQPDGKIIAAGSSASTADRDFMLFRLLPDGSLDSTFNLDGTVTTAVGPSDDEALSLALQPDGKILAAGYSSSEKDRDFALVRYNSDGTLDSSFGTEGMVVTPVGSSHDEITDVAVQRDGSIIISGSAQGMNGRVVVLGRYLADGKLDTSFAEKGLALSVVGIDAQAESVALSKDGHILVAGTYSNGQRRGLMVLGFDSNGQLDQTFGEKGVAIPADSSTFSEGYGMLVSEDGKIVVAGSVGKEGERDAALFGFTAAGHPDSSFERNGVLVSSAGEGDDALLDVTAAGETLTAAGFKTTGENREFLLITYAKGTTQENTGGSSLAMQTGGQLQATALTTGFSSGKDTSTALAAVSKESVVAVGESATDSGSSAAVSKYTLATTTASGTSSTTSSTSKLSPGNQYISTGEPYEVTRTTAIVPAEILNGLSSVTKRGIVFGTMPNPVLKDGSSSSSSSDTPVMSSLSPSNGKITGTSVTLSLATDVDATCKYGTTAGTAYDQIASTFSTTGAKTHSQLVSNLTAGTSYTYYVRCKNTSSGTVNTNDGEISFTVSSGGGSTDSDSGPVISNPLPSGTVSGTSATLSLTTDVAATCKYDTTSGTAYADMKNDFTAATGGKSHSASVSSLTVGSHTYYVRCQNTSSGAVNTTDEVISFTVTTGKTVYTAPEHSQQLFAVSDKMVSNALQNVGNFFVGTAIAADSTTASATTSTTAATTTSDFLEEGNTSEGSGNGAFSSKLKNLKPGTFFYARAYAISGGTTYYGNQVGFRTADSCFVATAAYGSVFHPSVQILRDFRDQFLRSNAVSRSLIDFYYSYSPSIADIISQHNNLRFAVRMLLLPVTGAAWIALQTGMLGLLLLAALFGLMLYWQRGMRRAKRV